jgi:Fibrinogen beta and gamma chains, C-terminal globular domain
MKHLAWSTGSALAIMVACSNYQGVSGPILSNDGNTNEIDAATDGASDASTCVGSDEGGGAQPACGGTCTPCDVGRKCAGVDDCALGLRCETGTCRGFSSCKEIKEKNSLAKTGAYTLESSTIALSKPYQVHCDMDTEGGGWTLALKVDGTKQTFAYDSALWADANLLNESSANPEMVEAKLAPFVTMPAAGVLLRFVANNVTKNLALGVPLDGTKTLREILATSGPTKTNLGADKWEQMIPGSQLQPKCREEGFNVGEAPLARVRIGIVADDSDSLPCSRDSRIGLGGKGGGCGQKDNVTSGNAFDCSAATPISVFGFVYVR